MPDFRQKIDQLRDTLVGVVPQPEGQIAQITYALIYKFMNDFDTEAVELGGKRAYFAGDYEQYAWHNLMRPQLDARAREALYAEALDKMSANPALPPLFRDIFRDARLPYKNPLTCDLFLKQIDDGFSHGGNAHTDDIGDAYEYLLQATGAQGGVGQFRTPRHIIQFIVDCVAPTATDTILDPAVGTAGFLIAAYKYILSNHETHETSRNPASDTSDSFRGSRSDFVPFVVKKSPALSAEQRVRLHTNFRGFDIDPTMVRTAQVNLYLHGFKTPKILPHDTLTSEDYWDERYDVILANPPFMTPKGGIQPHKKFSVAANRSEVLFTDYIATHLKPKGRAGFIVPEGIIFQSGKAYQQLRKNLVENSLYAVVSLPGGVFQPYAGVKTDILLLDASLAKSRDSILFVKVENDGFSLTTSRSKISKNDLPKAFVDITNFQKDGNCKLSKSSFIIPRATILADKDINLTGERYRQVDKAIVTQYNLVAVGQVISEQSERVKDKHEIPVWSVSNKDGFVDPETQFSKRVASEDTSNYKIIRRNYFAYNPSRINVGSIALNASDSVGCVSPMYVVFKIDEDKIDPHYLFYLIKHETFHAEIMRLSQGAVRSQLKFKDLSRIKVPLPPLEIQRDFVERIETKQRAIAAAREVITALETERRHFDPRPRALRENWPTVKLGDICKVESGFGFPLDRQGHTDLPFPFYKVSDMNTEGNEVFMTVANNTIDEKLATELRAKIFPKGTIIFPKIGAAIATNKKRILAQKATYDNNVMGLIPDESKTLSQYVYLWLQGINLSDWGSSSQPPSMSKTTVENVELPLPPLSIQREYIAEFEQETAIKAANQALITLMEHKIAATLAELWEGGENHETHETSRKGEPSREAAKGAKGSKL